MHAANLDEIDRVFRMLDREVWIVTAAAEDRRGGLTATWVAPASIDPQHPVLLAAIAPAHYTAELIDRSGCFAAHLLSDSQTELALHMALSSGRDGDKLADLDTRPGDTGSPILKQCMAWTECRVYARLAAGDRVYYWADVVAGGCLAQGAVLRERQLLATADAEQRGRLRHSLEADLAQQRPAQQAWRGALPGWLRP